MTGELLVKMVRNWFFLVFLMLFGCSLPAFGGNGSQGEKLFSPAVGKEFYRIGHEFVNSKGAISQSEVEEGVLFLAATMELDNSSNYVLPDMIRLACQKRVQADVGVGIDYGRLVYTLLSDYIDKYSDLEVAGAGVRFLLDQLNSREEREKVLGSLVQYLEGKNPVFDSELAVLLGVLMVEKTEFESAQYYFMYALSNNKYNRLAFAKLAELSDEAIEPAIYLQHLRLRLSENPLDIETSLVFAQSLEQFQLYQAAADAYGYCADLFGYLYPGQPLPAEIYRPWTMSYYNTERNQHKCLEIAGQLRQGGWFDLFVETVAARAALNIGDKSLADELFRAAEDKALKLVSGDEGGRFSAESLAWFYCFGMKDSEKALEWANKGYAADPHSAAGAALLTYSLVMDNQPEWAKTLIEGYEKNQVADLAIAKIHIQQDEKDLAIEVLKSAIGKGPGTLEGRLAREMLEGLGSEYIPPGDSSVVLMSLLDSFKQGVVPKFITPDRVLLVQLNTLGSRFAYGRDFGGSVTITNRSSEPLIIGEDGLFSGNIRIDASISGDITKEISELVVTKVKPSWPIEPDRSLVVPVQLVSSELREILFTYPQASLEIEFTVYVDPVVSDDGVVNRLADISPTKLVVKRPGIELGIKFLQNKLNSISRGPKSQRGDIARLFISLLAEQHAQANRKPLYKFKYADWLPVSLKSALLQSLGNDDWVTRVRIMSGMLSLPLDYELTDAVAENLNEPHWPVRLMAVYLLAKNQGPGFEKVLDWTAKSDSNELVRQMAIALGGVVEQPRGPAGGNHQGQQQGR